MKYLLVLGVVLFGIWLWRHNRVVAAREREAARQAATAAQSSDPNNPQTFTHMVACEHCGLHLPPADAVKGRLGHYCTDGHRRAQEK